MSRITGTTIASNRAQRLARGARMSEYVEHRRESIYDQEPPEDAKAMIALTIALIVGVVALVATIL